MRNLLIFSTLCVAATLAACGSDNTKPSVAGGPSAAPATTQPERATGTSQSNNVPPISSAHSGGGGTSVRPSSSTEKPDVDTAELDARIEKAEAKVKAKGATDADKRAAAAAYVERANIYYNAGRPNLYKFALGDFRRALRYQPDNAEAREKIDTLVSIYQSMGRPVPNNGNEL